jgi:hypothetical protein
MQVCRPGIPVIDPIEEFLVPFLGGGDQLLGGEPKFSPALLRTSLPSTLRTS